MNNLKILLRNKIILAVLAGLLAVSVLCAVNVTSRLNNMDKIQEQLDAMDWVLPLGGYDRIKIAEVQDEVYFAVKKDETAEILDAEGKRTSAMKGLKEACEENYFFTLDVRIHPEGYWLAYGPSWDWQQIRTCDGNREQYFQEKLYDRQLLLTEKPGYVIDRSNRTVMDLKTGNVIYTAKADERVVRQLGDFWIMEREIPWPNAGLTLTYLRDMNFQLALDGMLFDGIWNIDGDRIIGTVITTGTYDQLPEEVIAVENCVLDTSGKILFSDADVESGDLILLGAEDGYFFALENHEHYRMHFTDGSGFVDFAEGYEPVGTCQNGVFAFTDRAGKYGFRNKAGETIIPPIFDQASFIHQGMAVVTRGSYTGVIRLEGGAAYEN